MRAPQSAAGHEVSEAWNSIRGALVGVAAFKVKQSHGGAAVQEQPERLVTA
jgi:hypothetical protein